MSCTSCLHIEDCYMVTWCPGCGRRIEVDEDDKCATLDDGTSEYELWCPEEDCGCHFYVNVNYP